MKPVAKMTEEEKALIRAWIRNRQELGPILEQERRQALRCVNTAEAIAAFELACQSARLHCPRRQSSDLVEQQRWFKRGHR
jgi:hypothetical protein